MRVESIKSAYRRSTDMSIFSSLFRQQAIVTLFFSMRGSRSFSVVGLASENSPLRILALSTAISTDVRYSLVIGLLGPGTITSKAKAHTYWPTGKDGWLHRLVLPSFMLPKCCAWFKCLLRRAARHI